MLMIIGAGPMQIPAIRIAREMELRTLVIDYNADAPGMALADVPVIMSTKDYEGAVRIARTYAFQLQGVITVGTDASMTVAAVAGALGLPGITYEAAENATHKTRMRKVLRAAGVPVPDFAGARTEADARRAAERLGFPIVVKPVDNMGARGVIRVDGMDALSGAYRHARLSSISGEVIIERFMEGPELSIDALVYDGEIICVGIADRIIEMPPYFIETGHTMPSRLPKTTQDAAIGIMRQAVRALEINSGAAKGDIKITPDGPMVGECAARLSGGWMSSHTFPLATGYSIIRGAIEIALGKKPEIPPFLDRCSIERAVFARPGRVTGISGVAQAAAVPGVEEVILKCRIGDTVAAPVSNLDKQAHIIASADSHEECEKIVARAREMIRFETSTEHVLTMKSINDAARRLFGRFCRACPVCDGVACAGDVPGMGGIGTAQSFMNNLSSLAKYQMVQSVIHSARTPRMQANFLGYELAFPVFGAPVTGAVTNMGGAITEEEFAESVVSGSCAAGTIMCVGDGATPEKYRIGLDAAARARGRAIPIFKPRAQADVVKRVAAAVASGCRVVGMDVDGAAFVTMRSKGQAVGPKSVSELREIIAEARVPFVVKGIMTARDAESALEAGAAALIAGNHGGRVMDHMPGGADVLPEIVSAAAGSVPVVLDGGVRSGEDVLKALALGASFCMIGRPVAICAVGGRAEGVELYWRQLRDQIERAMILTGTENLGSVRSDIIRCTAA